MTRTKLFSKRSSRWMLNSMPSQGLAVFCRQAPALVLVPAARQPSHFPVFSGSEKCQRRSAMNMSVGVLDHYNVSTRKLDETVQFYEDVLGFTNGARPHSIFRRQAVQRGPSRVAPQTTSRIAISNSARIRASSIMWRSVAAASRR